MDVAAEVVEPVIGVLLLVAQVALVVTVLDDHHAAPVLDEVRAEEPLRGDRERQPRVCAQVVERGEILAALEPRAPFSDEAVPT